MVNTKKFLNQNIKLRGKIFNLRIIILSMTLLGLILETLGAFAIPFAVEYFKRGKEVIAILFLMYTVCGQVINTIHRLFDNHFILKYRMYVEELVNKNTLNILCTVKNKVYITDDKIRRRLSSIEIQENTKEYITRSIYLFDSFVKFALGIITFVVMFIGTIGATMQNVNHLPSLIIIITICMIAITFITIKQVKRRTEFFKHKVKISNEIKNQKMDLLNIVPINQKHQDFLTNAYVESSKNILQKELKLNMKNNLESCYKASTMALSIVILLLISILSYDNLNMEIFASLMALSTLYYRLLITLTHQIDSAQGLIEEYSEKESYNEIMEKVARKYLDLSSGQSKRKEKITDISMKDFKFIHEDIQNQALHQIRSDRIDLNAGEITFINGPTGSGKSTLLKILTGDYSYTENALLINKTFYVTTIYDYLVYDPESQIGNKSILEEITFCKSKSDVNIEKLFKILKGLELYDVIVLKAKNEPILDYLLSTFKDTFSSGQNQRFILARLLYNINEETKVIIFDEPIANLDNKTASSVIEYISHFSNEDSKRVVIISSHQVDIVKRYSDKNYNFINTGENIFKIELE